MSTYINSTYVATCYAYFYISSFYGKLQMLLKYYNSYYKLTISLGTLVPNSRDRHEKQWRPDFTHHKTHPKIRFV